ncbi:MAG: hypothetical protein SWX82_29960 [Cyanobacteriota bacterium]|nr:hypothetical protein [Cyanobacteriota bacterium]
MIVHQINYVLTFNINDFKNYSEIIAVDPLTIPWYKGLETAKPFVVRAKALWGGEVGWRTATSYDATKAFIDALSKSGDNPTRAKILEKLQDVYLPVNETSGKSLRFSPEGEREGEAFLVEVVESDNPDCSNLDFRLLEE